MPHKSHFVESLVSRAGKLHVSLVFSSLSLFLFLSLAGPAHSTTTLESKADANLRILIDQASRAETSGRPSSPGSDLPATNYHAVTPDTKIYLIIEGEVDRGSLEALGAEVNTEAGPITTVQASISLASAIAEFPNVRHVAAASGILPMLDVSAPAVDANDVWGGSPPFFTGLTGENVVIGIIDSGLDLNHSDFRNGSNLTRVKYAWDQTWTGVKPPGFNYGAEYSEAMINAGQASSFRDNDGHGTHVTGIAAGNGRATGNGQPSYRYIGVAPEADLVVVKTNFTDAGVIDGVNYIFQKAALLGKAAVVNLSVGTQKGGHDGSHALDTAISALTGQGKLVTAAAGNYGKIGIHTRANVAAAYQVGTVQFTVPAYTQTTVAPENVILEGWHDPGASFQVKLRSPSGWESNWISPGASSGYMTISDGSCIIDNGLLTNSRGGKLVGVTVYRAGTTTPHPAMGTWTIYLSRLGGTSSGICDFWVSSWKLSTTVSPSFPAADFARSITSPATGDNVIATGAYTTKSQWTNGNGGISSYGSVPLDALADFSSHGPRRDGTIKPDIVAPGYGVAAALSSEAPTSNTYKVLDHVHYMRIGTSQANAHTTGVLALLLQQNRWLTPVQARQELINRARKDSFTGSSPNDLYGYGKLDVVATVSGVEQVAPHVFRFAGPYPNPVVDGAAFQFSLSASDLRDSTTPVTIKLFDVSGRIVAETKFEAAEGFHEWKWDGHASDGGAVSGGVYFARLQVGDKASAIKFVKLER